MNDRAIRAIESYIYELKDPQMDWIKWRRDQCIYSRWAANEVLGYVKLHNDISAIQAVEEFIAKMDKYACLDNKNSYIFSVAYDIATDILDLLLCSL